MMNSSPILRQQSRSKIQSDHSRMKNEVSKMTGDPTASKYLTVPRPSKQGVENQDPAGSEHAALKVPVKPGISRLPVLAKSQSHFQAPSDFTQSHKRWEDNPLVGKSKRKKQCTKPIPFNFSQPKANRTMTRNHRPPLGATSQTGPQATQPEKSSHTARLKTRTIAASGQPQPKSAELAAHHSVSQHSAATKPGPAILAPHNRVETRGVERPPTRHTSLAATSPSQPPKMKAPSANRAVLESGQRGYFRVPKTFPSTPIVPAQAALSTESCLSHLLKLSLKDSPKTSRTIQPEQSPASGQCGSGEAFRPDPGALRSILQNEGVTAAGVPGSNTLRSTGFSSQACNYMPQRVSIMKSQKKAGPPTGTTRVVQFSPNIFLGNEEVNTGGPLRATPRNPACPTGRPSSVYMPQRVPVTKSRSEATPGPLGTTRVVQFSPTSILGNEEVNTGGPLRATPTGRPSSVYMPQRVPVTKSRSEATPEPLVMALKPPTPMNWTPGRVPITRDRSMSMRRLMSAHRTPYASPKLRGLQDHGHIKMETHKEEVIQRLFMETDQEEEEQSKDDEIANPDAETDKRQASSTEFLHSEIKGPSWSLEVKEGDQSTKGQTFFQAPHRESVIFFSTGKKLFRSVPAQEQEGGHGELEGPHPVHPDRGPASDTPTVPSSLSDMARQSDPSIQPRRGIVQKGGALSSVAALLRRRFPPLEELRLDEEVATFFANAAPSSSSSSSFSSCSLQPRCGDPIASLLHFQDYTSFVPIIDDLTTSGPASSIPSPLRQI